MSEQIPFPLIYSKIIEVMNRVGAIGKDGKNEQQGYKFRSIVDIYNHVHPILADVGVFCVPQVISAESADRATKTSKDTGTYSIRVFLTVNHKFYASDGSFVEVITVGEGIDTSDKAANKAMSAAMKYALVEMLCLPFAEVDEGDKSSPEAGVTKVKEPIKLPRPPQKDFPPLPAAVEREPGSDDGDESYNVPPVPADFDEGSRFGKPVEYCTAAQQKEFAIAFKKALPLSRVRDSEKLRTQFLEEYKLIDKDGNPSSTMIPAALFQVTLLEAINYAKGVGN